MANQKLKLETQMDVPPYSWGTGRCENGIEDVETIEGVNIQLGMKYDVTANLPWLETPWPFDLSKYSEMYLIKSAADFEGDKCASVESFYDCFSGVEKIINEGRW